MRKEIADTAKIITSTTGDRKIMESIGIMSGHWARITKQNRFTQFR